MGLPSPNKGGKFDSQHVIHDPIGCTRSEIPDPFHLVLTFVRVPAFHPCYLVAFDLKKLPKIQPSMELTSTHSMNRDKRKAATLSLRAPLPRQMIHTELEQDLKLATDRHLP